MLFAFFALTRLSIGGRKWLGVSLFFLFAAALSLGLFYFVKSSVIALPKIAEETIPKIIEFAEKRNFDLPFSDLASLKTLALESVREKISGLGQHARSMATELVSLIVGVFVAVSLFLTPQLDIGEVPTAARDNLYSVVGYEIVARIKSFYASFATVMGAQLLISLVNTGMTSVFLTWNHYPHLVVIVGMTFLFGLLPIVGNLLSNVLIIGIGITISPSIGLAALLFLVVIHKLEYFLNSKIVGQRTRNPMWMTLLGLVLGEKLMGVPGMILAPVVLHFVKVEASGQRASVLNRRERM